MSEDEATIDPADFAVPTIEELEAMRRAYGMSKAELTRRAGMEAGRWSYITTHMPDPQVSTIRAYLRALQEADADGFRVSPGRPPTEGEERTYRRLHKQLEQADKDQALRLKEGGES